MELQDQDPKNFGALGKESQYAEPRLVPTGKDSAISYVVVNQHGLDKMAKDGLISEEQRKQLTEKLDLIPASGDALTERLKSSRMSKAEIRAELAKTNVAEESKQWAEGQSPLKATDEAVKKIQAILEKEKDMARPDMFVVEFKKEGDKQTAARIFSGSYYASEFTPTNQAPAEVAINQTLDMSSPNSFSRKVDSLVFSIKRKMEKSSLGNLEAGPDGPPMYLVEKVTEENTKKFQEAVDKLKADKKITQADALDLKMQDALAKAADSSYQPSTPKGYEGSATIGGVAADKTEKSPLQIKRGGGIAA